MGRRPNQLILEYFERGPKLEDASNRYQHTCKSCGEKVRPVSACVCSPRDAPALPTRYMTPNSNQFPKGRIDSLTNHLVKKCPALPLRDRQRAVLQFHELPVPDNMAQSSASGLGQVQSGQKLSLPFVASKQLSALETLAEVSRQHLDLSGKRVAEKQPSQAQNHPSHVGLLDEFLIQDDRPDASDLGALSQGIDMANTPALPSMYQFNGSLHHSPTSSPHIGHMPLSSSASMAQMVPSLVMAASAANDLMPLTNSMTMEPDMTMTAQGIHGISDKNFTTQRGQWPNLQPNSLDPMLHDYGKDRSISRGDHMNKATAHPRPIAMNPNTQTHFTTDFSMNHKPPKPKVRGRFTDSRRKEVQEVRKRGACIRCRMLKKPCSGENPCNTCQNVESARLWKQPCIRTRIAEEFSLYSAGLHSVLAHHATNQAKGQIRLHQTPGRIEATHFPDSGTYVTFALLKCQQAQVAQNDDLDPAILAALAPPDLVLIDNDDDISGKLDLYVKKMGGQFLGNEDSAFMKSTSQIASSMTSSNSDGLLPKALELWHVTRLLTSRTMDWRLFSNPSLAPTMAPSTMSTADLEDAVRMEFTTIDHQASCKLIKMQLMGATEKRAACVARIVMNDLERRLLQRQQANPFETFLVAVILLACVERMCWLFRTWESQTPNAAPPHTQSVSQGPSAEHDLDIAFQSSTTHPTASFEETSTPSARNPQWPLDKSPASFSQQGERFSDILNMLLKMRGVPPKPVPRNTDGILAMCGDDVDDKVRDWYNSIAITNEVLDEKANARFAGTDSREWELRFISKVIRSD